MRPFEFSTRIAQTKTYLGKPLPSQETLQALLRYDPDVGALFWRKALGGCQTTRPAGFVQYHTKQKDRGYRTIEIRYCQYLAHRLVWAYHHGEIPEGMQVDHVNGDGLDNKLSNLRLVTPGGNRKNMKRNRLNTSGVSGVIWHEQRGKWLVRISKAHVGFYKDFADAVAARHAAEVEHGYHENHGRAAQAVAA